MAARVDRIKIDVFALGAVGYYLLTRRPPAADGNALREQLQRDKGLDLAADLPQVLSSLRTLVLDATRPAVGDRLASIGAFLDKLAEVERAVAEPDQAQELDPLKAFPGTVFRSRYRLQRRLVSRPLARGGGWRRLPSGAQTQPQRRGGTGTSILLLGFPWSLACARTGPARATPA